jgi:hypothetical protein
LIKYKGIQVAPAELEALLISHPDIADAAVIGVEAEGTEVPRAYVVADQKKMSAEKIAAFVKENVASYKQLRGGVIFLDVIPKSPSGKVKIFDSFFICDCDANRNIDIKEGSENAGKVGSLETKGEIVILCKSRLASSPSPIYLEEKLCISMSFITTVAMHVAQC